MVRPRVLSTLWTWSPATIPPVPFDGLVISRSNGRLTICSELVTATLDQCGETWRARVAVRERARSNPFYHVHLSVAFHRMLLALGRAYLHAAAVTVGGRTFVFIGEKGTGKSSIATSLGRAGATILSDDHVLLRSCASVYFVSGCEARARVTAETEAALFEGPLAIRAENFAGTSKKEFLVSDFFASRPHEDAVVDGLLFPRVGLELGVTPRHPVRLPSISFNAPAPATGRRMPTISAHSWSCGRGWHRLCRLAISS